MRNIRSITICILLLCGCSSISSSGELPIWLKRAPLNTDAVVLGIQGWGEARAHLWLALILNLAVLAGLVYLIAQHEAEFEYFLYAYLGILLGSLLISVVLSPYIHAASILAVAIFTVWLLMRVCLVSFKRAILVTFLFHLYQIGYISAFYAIHRALSEN